MRVLVTGAQGFVGRSVVSALLKNPTITAVLGLGRSLRNDRAMTHAIHWGTQRVLAPLPIHLREDLQSPRYAYESVSLLDRASVIRVLSTFQPGWILHLASGLRDDPLNQLLQSNVEGTGNLLEAVQAAGLSTCRIVLGSTGFLYGRVGDEALPMSEATPCVPIDAYGVTKLAAEQVAEVMARRYGLNVMRARIFNVVGPGLDERHLCAGLASQATAIAAGALAAPLSVGPLSTTRDFIDVEDVAQALLTIAQCGIPGEVYNVASGQETPVRQVQELLLELTGLTPDMVREDRPARSADIPRYVADVSKLAALGFTPHRDLRTSLKSLCDYYRGETAAACSDHVAPLRASTYETTVEVQLRQTYPIRVAPGLLSAVPHHLKTQFPGARMVVLTDERVEGLYARRVLEGLRALNVECALISIPEGEISKSMECYQEVIARLQAARFDRRAVLVAVGGGLISDLGGFVAASYMRGVRYVCVPTTLLAQHDAAVGGKVAVNTAWAKNFVGAFHHPSAVFCDPEVLRTLSDRDISAGIAEALKVALCGDPLLFSLIEEEVQAIQVRKDPRVLGEVVSRSVETKLALLAPDPYEVDLRRALNLGHTFGHALETQTGYTLLLHGEAVGFGLAVATEVSRGRGRISHADAERIYRALLAHGLPPKVPYSELKGALHHFDAIRQVRGRQLNFVLPAGIGRVEIVPEVSTQEVSEALQRLLIHPRLRYSIGVEGASRRAGRTAIAVEAQPEQA